MSAIHASLQKLTTSVDNLEAAIDLIEEAMVAKAGGQPDMFSNGAGKAIADRLDNAIRNVETVLEEG